MGRLNLPCVVVIVLALALYSASGLSAAGDTSCVQIRHALKRKKQLVSEYMRALQTSYDRKEQRITELLNFKINELNAQIRELERNLAGCQQTNAERTAEGMETTKSDEGRYADKSCLELRKTLFTLVRQIHALNRRKNSLLLNFTEKEELLLQEATEQREAVERALRSKCSVKKARRGLLRRLRH